MANKLKTGWTVLSDSLRIFIKNDPLRMAGATAFFTLFALPPILIILVRIFSLIIDPKTIHHEVFASLSEVLGREAARQVVTVIRAFRQLTYTWVATIIGFIFLLFVATTVFRVVKSSINQIWQIDKPEGKKVLITLQSRLQSLLVIFSMGILFSIGVFIETVQVVIGNYVIQILPALSAVFSQLLSFVISTLITSVWFLVVFRYLADGRPQWPVAWAGALFTSLLFSAGKIILHVLLTYNNITTIYGASASVVLLLLFVFYSSMILYFGAAFTFSWNNFKGMEIEMRHGLLNKKSATA
jgi:membrane protein